MVLLVCSCCSGEFILSSESMCLLLLWLLSFVLYDGMLVVVAIFDDIIRCKKNLNLRVFLNQTGNGKVDEMDMWLKV